MISNTCTVTTIYCTPPPTALINRGQLAIIISIFNQPHVVLLCGLSSENMLSSSFFQDLVTFSLCFVSCSSALSISCTVQPNHSSFFSPSCNMSSLLTPLLLSPFILSSSHSLCIPSLLLSD
ncbi:hypothetical protein GOODEAATRI_013179 [Goodea atripinnis]|uniref:Uncharacterized protein n=1 Tax=Goodea atripinnis TaxID=208336 RepID=A0ABV0PDP6_9TELE